MADEQKCRCKKCILGEDLRAAVNRFADGVSPQAPIEEVAALVRILSYELTFQTTAIAGSTNDPLQATMVLRGAMIAGATLGGKAAASAIATVQGGARPAAGPLH